MHHSVVCNFASFFSTRFLVRMWRQYFCFCCCIMKSFIFWHNQALSGLLDSTLSVASSLHSCTIASFCFHFPFALYILATDYSSHLAFQTFWNGDDIHTIQINIKWKNYIKGNIHCIIQNFDGKILTKLEWKYHWLIFKPGVRQPQAGARLIS